MKVQFVAACLLGTLATGALAESPPPAEAPAAPSSAPTPPEVSPRLQALDAQRQRLEAQLEALTVQQRELEANIERLEVEQQSEAERQQLAAEARASVSQGPHDSGNIADVFGFSLIGFVVWLFANHRRQRMVHETVRRMVEKGTEIPTGLLAPAPRKASDLRRGIILSTSGLGLAIFLGALPGADGAWSAGVMLLLIGVGHLIVWRLQNMRGAWSSALASELQP
jgi:hypothetical protein